MQVSLLIAEEGSQVHIGLVRQLQVPLNTQLDEQPSQPAHPPALLFPSRLAYIFGIHIQILDFLSQCFPKRGRRSHEKQRELSVVLE